MRSWRVRFPMVIAVVALVTGGCTDESGAPTAAGGGGAPRNEPQEVTIVAADYEYSEAPVELEGGVINLSVENQGTVVHEVALAGIGDTTLERFVQDLEGGSGLGGKPFPDYLDQVAVPIVDVQGGTTREATFTLTEGRYAMFCSFTDVAEGDEKAPHYKLGMIRALTVSGGDAEPSLPEADGTITATDYVFEVDLQAGDSSVNFINEGPDQVHYTSVELYPDGIDAGEAEAAFKAQLEPGRVPEGVPQPEGLGFSGIFSEGLGSTFQLDESEFESGRTYLFACYITDREGGKPHTIAYNMYKVVTID